jgi:hypothetical protein
VGSGGSLRDGCCCENQSTSFDPKIREVGRSPRLRLTILVGAKLRPSGYSNGIKLIIHLDVF